MEVADIQIRVKRQFGDESGVQVTDDDILRWINDAQREAVMQHENLLQAAAVMPSIEGQSSYPLPDDLFTLQSISYKGLTDTSYYALRFTAPVALDSLVPGWDGSAAGSPSYPTFYARSRYEGLFDVWPAPDSSLNDAFKIVYSRYANVLTNSSNPIDLPVYYHQWVLEYCLMKAYEMDEDWEAAAQKAAYVQSTLSFNNTRESWFGQEKYPVVSPVAEDYY